MMATENKRQSTGGKGPVGMAPPGVGPSGAVAMEMALCGAIGARIRVNTTSPTSTTHEGTLFAACPITNLIAINTSPPPPTPMTSGTPALSHPGDYHIIPISRIHNFQLLSLPPHSASSSPTEQTPSFANAYPSIYPLDIRALKNREAAAVSKLHEREQRRGKGVSKEAQDLFDAFSRTMPARWDGTSIVVADTVIISKPYHIDNCRSLSPDNGGVSPALTRVRKVLEMERKKIELRSASAAIANSSHFSSHQARNSNHGNNNHHTNANANVNNSSPSTSRDRDRNAKAAAVALPITNNNNASNNAARSSTPGTSATAATANQRKGG
ncbi:Lsm12p-like protein [Histoplasma capsulatum G186AR]|nr:Lsm12p-like protein [Histoplasma capsulatum]QSS67314.1 Lsm12p-like protein [Histoplasma capsulatum G186AR]